MFIYVPIIVLLIFWNPLCYKVLSKAIVYFRICWILPITCVMAYAAVQLYESVEQRFKGWVAALCIVIIAFSGRLCYSSPLFSRAENIYHVPEEVVKICDEVKIEGREVMALFPDEFLLYVRQYASWVCMPYGREVLMGEYNAFHYEMTKPIINAEVLAGYAKEKLCHYLVIPKNKVIDGNLENYSYEFFMNLENYEVYKDTTMNFGLQ